MPVLKRLSGDMTRRFGADPCRRDAVLRRSNADSLTQMRYLLSQLRQKSCSLPHRRNMPQESGRSGINRERTYDLDE
jgi:hypothetical protein